MTISSSDQIGLLYDILNNHKVDCCGSISECEQIQRIIQSLLHDPHVSSDIKSTLTDIHQYSLKPKSNNDLDHHIQLHNNHITNWLSSIESYTN
jgi:hypothetical protein